MNKHITIDWPFESITLHMKPDILRNDQPLKPHEWRALEAIEKKLYDDQHGCYGWTDVNQQNEPSTLLREVWDHCFLYLDGNAELDDLDERAAAYKIAHRVARALKLMAFGPESLLA